MDGGSNYPLKANLATIIRSLTTCTSKTKMPDHRLTKSIFCCVNTTATDNTGHCNTVTSTYLSTNAKSMAPVTLEVVRMITLGNLKCKHNEPK